MVQIEGKYVNDRNEKLDEYFKDVGVPYIPRKLMCSSTPSLEIKKDNDQWIITTTTMLRTNVIKFTVGEEYDEHMPGGVLKNTTVLEGDTFVTNSIGPDSVKAKRIYQFSEEGCVIEYSSDKSSHVAKRYFKRA